MKNKITISTIVIFLFYSFASLSQTIKWEDRMNGDNSMSGLLSRGWIILDEDGGGITDPWFQGGSFFNSVEGTDTGYVASNFNGANDNDVLDQWLISPPLTVALGDTLFFWARSPVPGIQAYDDSINFMYSTNAGITSSGFVSMGRLLVPTTDWLQYYFAFPENKTVRFAIRYYLFDAFINANYIGLDFFQIISHPINYPTTIPINKSFPFTNITETSSYRMIGLPGQTNFAIPVTGTRKTDWNAFYDNGAATNYLIEYDGTANFNFKPGNGFWLLSKNTISLNIPVVNSVPLAGDNTYSILLHTGWNIISNPFERSTNWSAIKNVNTGLEVGNAVICDWGGSWTYPTVFLPYKGYYFNNTFGLTSLNIPYDPGGTLGKTSEENALQISGENDIKLSLLSNGEEKSKAFIGFNSESTNDFDKEDYFAPPGDFEEARIVIRNSNLSTNYKFLMKETRREIGEGQIYNLEVKNLTGQDLILKSEGIANRQNYLFYLIDERLNNAIKLSEDLKIKIAVNVKNNNYRLLIGTQQFIDANKENLAPTAFALYQNYPNPFNPTTVIRYSVPQSSLVSIKLFDILGNEVMTLLNEVKSPGNYELEFSTKSGSASGGNGFSLASGVYIYKFQAGPITQSKKMILLR